MAGTLVAGNLIRAARDEHPTFDDRRHPDPVLLRALSRYQRELLGRITRLDPAQGIAHLDTTLPLSSFSAGITVAACKKPFGAEVTLAGHHVHGKTHPVDLIPWREKAAYRHAVYFLDGVLYLTGQARDWVHFSMLRFYYVPEPASLALDDTVILTLLPDAAEPTLVAFLASKMAQRGGAGEGQTPPDPASFAADWMRAEDRFFDEMAANTQAVTSTVREVF
jgi:hypothetical protein